MSNDSDSNLFCQGFKPASSRQRLNSQTSRKDFQELAKAYKIKKFRTVSKIDNLSESILGKKGPDPKNSKKEDHDYTIKRSSGIQENQYMIDKYQEWSFKRLQREEIRSSLLSS